MGLLCAWPRARMSQKEGELAPIGWIHSVLESRKLPWRRWGWRMERDPRLMELARARGFGDKSRDMKETAELESWLS